MVACSTPSPVIVDEPLLESLSRLSSSRLLGPRVYAEAWEREAAQYGAVLTVYRLGSGDLQMVTMQPCDSLGQMTERSRRVDALVEHMAVTAGARDAMMAMMTQRHAAAFRP